MNTPRFKLTIPTKPSDPVAAVLISAMVAVLIACVVLIWTISKLNNTPTWWKALDQIQTTEQAAIELENRITSALTRLRLPEDSDWSAAIDESSLNSWLAHRLKDTIESFSNHETSSHTTTAAAFKSIGAVRMMIEQSKLTIGARFTHLHGSSIVWITTHLNINPQGQFIVDIQKARIGTTPIPAQWISKHIQSNTLGDAKVDLGDGREVQIRAVRTGDHRLEFILRTQPIN